MEPCGPSLGSSYNTSRASQERAQGGLRTAQSHKLDLGELTKRLEKVVAAPASPASTNSIEELGEDECYRPHTENPNKQEEVFDNLRGDGGRPSHPPNLSLGDRGDPEFEMMSQEWLKFEEWQERCRTKRFDKYAAWLRDCLPPTWLTQPFQLNVEPTHQDKQTICMEYWAYSKRQYQKAARFLESLEPQYRDQWAKLQQSKLLKPDDTEEFIWNITSPLYHNNQKAQAQSAVDSAQKDLKCAVSQQKDLRELEAKLKSALDERQFIEKRNTVVATFRKNLGQWRLVNGKFQRSYWEAKKDAARRQTHLCWIVQQIHLLLESDRSGLNSRKRKAPDLGCHGIKRQRREELSDGKIRMAVYNRGKDSITPQRSLSIENSVLSKAPRTNTPISRKPQVPSLGHEPRKAPDFGCAVFDKHTMSNRAHRKLSTRQKMAPSPKKEDLLPALDFKSRMMQSVRSNPIKWATRERQYLQDQARARQAASKKSSPIATTPKKAYPVLAPSPSGVQKVRPKRSHRSTGGKK